MNGVMIIPTGIGAEIGGHAGDANPATKLIASVCDTLILHPNVVNGSDVNEMPDNCLYVEGSILDKFLQGYIELKPVKKNKILVVVNPPIRNDTINAVSSARVTIGVDAEMMVLDTPLEMIAEFDRRGTATGTVRGWKELVKQVSYHDFDALAIATLIKMNKQVSINYARHGGVCPYGGVEAKASKLIANALNKPVAHAPIDDDQFKDFDEVVDPRIAPEMISCCFLHCVLKGLHKAPRIGTGINRDDIDFMISPWGCVGPPHNACFDSDIPVIMVRENKTCLNYHIPDQVIKVDNYLEAIGYIKAMDIGITTESVRRPFPKTMIG